MSPFDERFPKTAPPSVLYVVICPSEAIAPFSVNLPSERYVNMKMKKFPRL
jgi:hypothetical protein